MKVQKYVGYLFVFLIGMIIGIGIHIGNYLLPSYTILNEGPKGIGIRLEGPRVGNKDWFLKAKYININNYKIYAPIGSKINELTIFYKDYKNIIQINDNAVCVVFNASQGNFDSRQPKIITGIFFESGEKGGKYTVSYDLLDSSGKAVGYISDYNRDGVADYKLLVNELYKRKEYYFIDNAWHDAKAQNGVQGAIVNGKWREIHLKGPNYIFD